MTYKKDEDFFDNAKVCPICKGRLPKGNKYCSKKCYEDQIV